MRIDYQVQLVGSAPAPAVDVRDELAYLRPSRYCESDRMAGFAVRLFHMTSKMRTTSSQPSLLGSALSSNTFREAAQLTGLSTLCSRGRGVCVISRTLRSRVRALEIPARLVAVHAGIGTDGLSRRCQSPRPRLVVYVIDPSLGATQIPRPDCDGATIRRITAFVSENTGVGSPSRASA